MGFVYESWLDQLESALARVRDRFREHCAKLGITGDVELNKTLLYRDYGINIKVKFRDDEDLHVLGPQRQSGGERAVTTMLYLLALQDLNKCPIRVVDEINQGVDTSCVSRLTVSCS